MMAFLRFEWNTSQISTGYSAALTGDNTQKTPKKEIEKAMRLKQEYFESKSEKS